LAPTIHATDGQDGSALLKGLALLSATDSTNAGANTIAVNAGLASSTTAGGENGLALLSAMDNGVHAALVSDVPSPGHSALLDTGLLGTDHLSGADVPAPDLCSVDHHV
jgi:hypothetical protein